MRGTTIIHKESLIKSRRSRQYRHQEPLWRITDLSSAFNPSIQITRVRSVTITCSRYPPTRCLCRARSFTEGREKMWKLKATIVKSGFWKALFKLGAAVTAWRLSIIRPRSRSFWVIVQRGWVSGTRMEGFIFIHLEWEKVIINSWKCRCTLYASQKDALHLLSWERS